MLPHHPLPLVLVLRVVCCFPVSSLLMFWRGGRWLFSCALRGDLSDVLLFPCYLPALLVGPPSSSAPRATSFASPSSVRSSSNLVDLAPAAAVTVSVRRCSYTDVLGLPPPPQSTLGEATVDDPPGTALLQGFVRGGPRRGKDTFTRAGAGMAHYAALCTDWLLDCLDAFAVRASTA